MKIINKYTSIIIALTATYSTANAQVLNGSFEDNPFGSSSQFGSPALIAPWSVTGTNGAIPNSDPNSGNTTFGDQFVASKGASSISQNINLSAGSYSLVFSVANYVSSSPTNPATNNQMGFSLSNSSLASGLVDAPFGAGITGYSSGANAPMDFNTYAMNFTTTGGTSTLQFDMDLNVIDNISIRPIPEPSGSLLIGLGMISLIIRRKK